VFQCCCPTNGGANGLLYGSGGGGAQKIGIIGRTSSVCLRFAGFQASQTSKPPNLHTSTPPSLQACRPPFPNLRLGPFFPFFVSSPHHDCSNPPGSSVAGRQQGQSPSSVFTLHSKLVLRRGGDRPWASALTFEAVYYCVVIRCPFTVHLTGDNPVLPNSSRR
jgi:hypothetical protein